MIGGDQMTEMKFFVYGSFAEGFVHFEKIKNFVVDSLPAQILAQAFRLKVGFPVIVEGGEDAIPGYLVTLRVSDFLIGLLDQFHGVVCDDEKKSLFFRKQVRVLSPQGEETAWTYVLNPAKLPKNAMRILGGDWLTSLRAEPALTEKLTERQKHYISRLASVTGREIIPINDLSLYRELMNLELIVDKGRRLALSKLGYEVFRYLG
jgi:gamma-glutamylcyclotransferase (GGCT)/AIG2-like uncharacterized protein YtfP